MKYIVILADGMAGRPMEQLGGRTTLEVAKTPVMDRLAGMSEIGTVSMVPEGMAPGSDTANLAVLGYNPLMFYTGRSPLEALSIGVDMEDTDISFRCNLVTLSEDAVSYEEQRMIDHSSDEISTKDAEVLLKALIEGLAKEGYHFYRGTSYRHLLIWENGKPTELTPPHDILTQRIGDYLPADDTLRTMMEKSYQILKEHPLNRKRKEAGLKPANSAWFWGAGKRPSLTSFTERTGKKGVMISAVDLLKGIAVGAGMDNISVEGANGGLNTNYAGKATAAVEALTEAGYDFAYVHIEAPDEMGHQGNAGDKIMAIERIDELVAGNIMKGLSEAKEDYRLLLLPDHPTPVAIRTHTGEPVPYLLYDSTKKRKGSSVYNEKTAQDAERHWPDGYMLMGHLLEEARS